MRQYIKYITKPGDTLFGIANKYGVTINSILSANPEIVYPFLINIGQIINIPTTASGPIIYTVKSGDTFTLIAKKFGVTLRQLILENPQIANINTIYPGLQVRIPVITPNQSYTTYIALPGDTFYSIALKFHIPLSDIFKANPQFTNYNLLYPGTKVFIPIVQPTIPTVINIPLNFVPSDAILDPINPVIYFLDKIVGKLYSVNIITKESYSVTFNLAPESFTYAKGELFIALLISGHHYYSELSEKGSVAIVDARNLGIKEQFEVNIDPFDIVVGRDGYIYIPSGSNQWTNIKSYSRTTKIEKDSATIRMQSYAELHPTLNRIYTITTDSSPRDYTAYNISEGTFTDPRYPGGYDSPYHGDYPLGVYFRISPDGKYLFNESGTIFFCAVNKSEDMKYANTLNRTFTDIAFRIDANRFYIGIPGKKIIEYNYTTFEPLTSFSTQGEVVKLFSRGNNLISVSKASESMYFIESILVR